jgi:hypothetical protein
MIPPASGYPVIHQDITAGFATAAYPFRNIVAIGIGNHLPALLCQYVGTDGQNVLIIIKNDDLFFGLSSSIQMVVVFSNINIKLQSLIAINVLPYG